MNRLRRQHGDTVWHFADASRLAFADRSFSGAISALAIHHFRELETPFSEVRRALVSGRYVLVTGLAEQMRAYWLCHYFPEMMRRSIADMPTESMVRDALEKARFSRIETVPFFVTPGLEDLFLYSGKHRPRMYFDPSIRKNIGSFARLIDAAQLRDGLEALARDLETGAFESVKAQFASHEGDYAFVIAHTDS